MHNCNKIASFRAPSVEIHFLQLYTADSFARRFIFKVKAVIFILIVDYFYNIVISLKMQILCLFVFIWIYK